MRDYALSSSVGQHIWQRDNFTSAYVDQPTRKRRPLSGWFIEWFPFIACDRVRRVTLRCQTAPVQYAINGWTLIYSLYQRSAYCVRRRIG